MDLRFILDLLIKLIKPKKKYLSNKTNFLNSSITFIWIYLYNRSNINIAIIAIIDLFKLKFSGNFFKFLFFSMRRN